MELTAGSFLYGRALVAGTPHLGDGHLLYALELFHEDGPWVRPDNYRRINGVLGPEQVMAMKIRQHPFAVYFKYLSPHAGKEVVYAEGQHENKIIAHSGGVARFLVPRLAVPPDHPLASPIHRGSINSAASACSAREKTGGSGRP